MLCYINISHLITDVYLTLIAAWSNGEGEDDDGLEEEYDFEDDYSM